MLDAVAPVFARAGFAGATTRELAAAARVNVSTLAWWFGDKQGLYDALVDRTYRRLAASGLSPAAGGADPDPLRAAIGAAWSFARGHRDEIRVLVRHVLDHERLPAAHAQWFLPVATAVLDVAARARLRTDDPLAFASVQHLLVRYAIADAGDLPIPGTPAEVEAKLLAHLQDAASRLLRPA
jgi:AcrR family transcriptional regulator